MEMGRDRGRSNSFPHIDLAAAIRVRGATNRANTCPFPVKDNHTHNTTASGGGGGGSALSRQRSFSMSANGSAPTGSQVVVARGGGGCSSRQRRASEGSGNGSSRGSYSRRWWRKTRRNHGAWTNRIGRNSQSAPNNNNEFLMEEHDKMDDSPFCSQSDEDEEDFQSKDFSQAYDVGTADRVYAMTKDELIYANHVLELRVENLEKRLGDVMRVQEEEKPVTCQPVMHHHEHDPSEMFMPHYIITCPHNVEAEEGAVPIPEADGRVDRLQYENGMLKLELESLRRSMGDSHKEQEDADGGGGGGGGGGQRNHLSAQVAL